MLAINIVVVRILLLYSYLMDEVGGRPRSQHCIVYLGMMSVMGKRGGREERVSVVK